jgi:hypothetical protein
VPVVKAACRAARVSRETAYELRKQDAEFSREWDEALEDGWIGSRSRRSSSGCRRGKKLGRPVLPVQSVVAKRIAFSAGPWMVRTAQAGVD